MGYTVYFELVKEVPESVLAVARQKAKRAYEGALSHLSSPTGKTLERVRRDARERRGNDNEYRECFFESFYPESIGEHAFDFVKTGRRVYDFAVKKALIEFQKATGDALRVRCDDGCEYTSGTVLGMTPYGSAIPVQDKQRLVREFLGAGVVGEGVF